jgi:hypothetical protein
MIGDDGVGGSGFPVNFVGQAVRSLGDGDV